MIFLVEEAYAPESQIAFPDMLHDHKLVSAKAGMFCGLCKKINFNAKIIYFSWYFFVLFYIGHKEKFCYVKLLSAHIEHVSLRTKKFPKYFNFLKHVL
jgi:hypothetical protein